MQQIVEVWLQGVVFSCHTMSSDFLYHTICISCCAFRSLYFQISWEDERERAYRLQYQNLRETGALVWDCSGEREAQERSRARAEARRNQPVTWDDADERACMESYRNKYKK